MDGDTLMLLICGAAFGLLLAGMILVGAVAIIGAHR
jgi:hypothetical protein